MALYDSANRLLWEWDGRRNSLAMQPSQQLVFADPVLSADGVTVLLAGEDPALELPIAAAVLTGLREGGELRLELSWPMSLDYLALAQDCIPRRDAEAARAELARRVEELEASVTVLTERNAGLEAATATQNAREVERETEWAALAARTIELEQQAAVLQARLHEQSAELTGLRAVLGRSWRERLWGRLRGWRDRP